MNRLESLIEFYREDPTDPFNLYALALEYQQIEPHKATECFLILLSEFPDYLPTYYQAAEWFFSLDDFNRTESIYQAGIALAEKTNATKTLKELRGAYQIFLDEL